MNTSLKNNLDHIRLDAVKLHVNNILKEGRNHFNKSVQIFANGIKVRTKEQIKWKFPNYKESIISNFSCQQNLMRILVLLTDITGDSKYKEVVQENMKCYFKRFQDKNGLLRWGGHQFIDLQTLESVGPDEKNGVHELKNCFPFYDFMFTVDSISTVRFIKSFWNSHVYNWNTLEISRHGDYQKVLNEKSIFKSDYFTKLHPYHETRGLSFLNAGNDLIYSGALLFKYTGDEKVLRWTKRLIYQFINARHPQTKLGAYQFSQPIKLRHPIDNEDTNSACGDRAQRQFGPDFEPNPDEAPIKRRVLEAKMLLEDHAISIYVNNALMQLQVGKELGKRGTEIINDTINGLLAFKKYAYNSLNNTFKPLITDGTDLSHFIIKRNGYYGKLGTVIEPYPATCNYLLSYVRAYSLTNHDELWEIIIDIANANGLGYLGDTAGVNCAVNFETNQDDPYALFALIDLYNKTRCLDYLNLARNVGNNIYYNRFVKEIGNNKVCYFMGNVNNVFVNFDTIEPYALLALHAAINGRYEIIPSFINGSGYTEGDYRFSDLHVEKIRDSFFFDLKND